MKIQLAYPKIPGPDKFPPNKCIAFEKYDGTNLHWNWNLSKGWIGFGTRRDIFDLNKKGVEDFHAAHPGLENCVSLFEKIVKPLETTLLMGKYSISKDIVIFTEYFGPNSFAGSHELNDEKTLVVIDVKTDWGFITPSQFAIDLEHYLLPGNSPRIVYSGKYNGQFIEDVRNNKYKVNEGVVCKGMSNGQLYMTKIKTHNYLERLKEKFNDNWKEYWE